MQSKDIDFSKSSWTYSEIEIGDIRYADRVSVCVSEGAVEIRSWMQKGAFDNAEGKPWDRGESEKTITLDCQAARRLARALLTVVMEAEEFNKQEGSEAGKYMEKCREEHRKPCKEKP